MDWHITENLETNPVRLVTYEGCHVDTVTSCEKVMDLPHQAIVTCLIQLYLLEAGEPRGEAWSRRKLAST